MIVTFGHLLGLDFCTPFGLLPFLPKCSTVAPRDRCTPPSGESHGKVRSAHAARRNHPLAVLHGSSCPAGIHAAYGRFSYWPALPRRSFDQNSYDPGCPHPVSIYSGYVTLRLPAHRGRLVADLLGHRKTATSSAAARDGQPRVVTTDSRPTGDLRRDLLVRAFPYRLRREEFSLFATVD